MIAYNLKCNAYTKPIQIDDLKPMFSWGFIEGKQGEYQEAYQIIVTKNNILSGITQVWDSKKICSEQNFNIAYEGENLEPDSTYLWKVKIWSNQEESEFCEETFFETGLMQQWQGNWIGYDALCEGQEAFLPDKPFYCSDDFELGENEYYLPPVPYLRKEFSIKKVTLSSAKLYVSAFGLAEVTINGNAVTDARFVPGISDYKRTVYAKAFDVTSFIKEKNAIGVLLADGWYAGYIGLNSREWYGSKPRVMLQLRISYVDGTQEIISSNADWKASYGALLESDIFQGETYDATKELGDWDKPNYNDAAWEPVDLLAEYALSPTAHNGTDIVEQEILRPKWKKSVEEDSCLVDLEDDISGTLILHVRGNKGAYITIRHAEILNKDGTLYYRGNRSARCQDTYILKGEGVEIFKPKFTYHGFRYAEITGAAHVEILRVEAVRFGSKQQDATEFYCSNEVVNGVFDMLRKTQVSNQFEVPTDCNARDERLGWGMEGNHFLYAVTYMSNQELFIRKWARDIWDGQRENGALEAIAPPMMMKDVEQFVGDLQSNHGIHMIYALYRMYGNYQLVEKQYASMERYFEFLECNADRFMRMAASGDWLGIWESTEHSDVEHGYGDCSPAMIGTGHYGIITRMMIEMSEAIGREREAAKYRELYQNIKKAFSLNFIQRNGLLRLGKQGDYVVALAAGFFEGSEAKKAIDWLCTDLKKDGHIYWKGGTPSTPYFLDVLKKYGREDIANEFLISEQYPSVGYMRKKGAFTIWERWDGIYEDGTLHPQVMNAMNHIGFVVISKYFVSGLAGIDALEAGFKKILLQPSLTDKIQKVSCTYNSIMGKITADSMLTKNGFKLKCVIPLNTSAKLVLPYTDSSYSIKINEKILSKEQYKIESINEYQEQKAIFELPAGTYFIKIGRNM